MTRSLALSLLIFISGTHVADAHVPNLVHPENPDDAVIVEDPGLSQAFYGRLDGFPHAYEVHSDESFSLSVKLLVPDIDEAKNDISAIIVEMPEREGRVREVTRLYAKDAAWVSEFEPWGGDTYRIGPSYEATLEPGTYRLEVNTPNNEEPYVLVVGEREEMTIGYLELVGRIAGVKQFFGKSQLRIVESPFVYVPLLGLIILSGIVGYIRRRRLA